MQHRVPPVPASLWRRRLVLSLASVCAAPWAQGEPDTLPLSHSLQLELSRALEDREPLVVMVSLPGCPYCHAVRTRFLLPMHSHKELRIVQMDMGSSHPSTDFTGGATTHAEIIRAWGVHLAPTLLFFGRRGMELAERLVGASVPDFYGAYLDERLQAARQHLRN